jgi:AbrB family looped-hinge helix DNA binding protein
MNRKIDRLGRLVIPKEMRDELGIKNGDKVKIELKGNKIIVTKYEKCEDRLNKQKVYIYN